MEDYCWYEFGVTKTTPIREKYPTLDIAQQTFDRYYHEGTIDTEEHRKLLHDIDKLKNGTK